MSMDLWGGALLSIPIGIATGLAVNPIQKWIENRGEARAAIKLKETRMQYERVLFYLLHPHLFTQYLLQTVIRTTFVGAAVGIFLGIIHAIPNAFVLTGPSVVRGNEYPPQIVAVVSLGILAQLATVVSSVLIARYCIPALQLWNQLRNFEEYVKSVPSEHRDTTLEQDAMGQTPWPAKLSGYMIRSLRRDIPPSSRF
jgi:hypothetical protein